MITNQDISEAAFRLFAEKGYYETTTENIAKELGLKKQSLYSHYGSKNEIFSTVLRENTEKLNGVVDGIMAEYRDAPTEELLKFLFLRLTFYLSEQHRLLFWKRMFLLDTNGELSEILADNSWRFDQKIRHELEDILRSRYPSFNLSEKADSFFLSFMIMLLGYLDWMLIAGFDDDTAQTTWNSFWNGVRFVFQ